MSRLTPVRAVSVCQEQQPIGQVCQFACLSGSLSLPKFAEPNRGQIKGDCHTSNHGRTTNRIGMQFGAVGQPASISNVNGPRGPGGRKRPKRPVFRGSEDPPCTREVRTRYELRYEPGTSLGPALPLRIMSPYDARGGVRERRGAKLAPCWQQPDIGDWRIARRDGDCAQKVRCSRRRRTMMFPLVE